MSESIRYVSTNSNLTFDFNYQKAGLDLLIKALRKNDKTSVKLKEELIEKTKPTLGLNRLPESDRVTPFFHFQVGKFHVSFLFDSPISMATPWETIIVHNFRELIPLFVEIYDLLKRPIFDYSSATIGNFSVFHHQNAIGYNTGHGIAPLNRYIEYNGPHDKDEETGEESSVYDDMDGKQNGQLNRKNDNKDNSNLNINSAVAVKKSAAHSISGHRHIESSNHNKHAGEDTGEESSLYESNRQVRRSARQSLKNDQTINSRVLTIKKSTTTTKKGKRNLVTKSIEMSSSMPNLNNTMNSTGMFSHRYGTRYNNKNFHH